MMKRRFLSVMLAAAAPALAGCNATSRVAEAEMSMTGSVAQRGRPVAMESAFVQLPPAAGPVKGVEESVYGDGVSQRIALGAGADANNSMDVSIRWPESGQGSRIAMEKPTHNGIQRELVERFPGIQMQVVARPMRNAYGPFGLAIGRGAGDVRCAYAWQWIDDAGDLRAQRGGMLQKLSGGSPASVRLRVCRAGVSVDDLAAAMGQMAINRNAKVIANEPFNRAEGRYSTSLENEISPQTAVATISPPAPSPTKVAQKKPVQRTVRRAPSPVQQPQQLPVYAPQETDGPRYLAPVAGTPRQRTSSTANASAHLPAMPMPSVPRIPAPQPQAAAPARLPMAASVQPRQQVSTNLPAAAYRGPVAANKPKEGDPR